MLNKNRIIAVKADAHSIVMNKLVESVNWEKWYGRAEMNKARPKVSVSNVYTD